ncbi:MAG: TlpA disulfide reductase family protein [Pseudomonadota bacterium]|nr:TlpA disulfide reductase family protein [Pseudomonadota bacterium]
MIAILTLLACSGEPSAPAAPPPSRFDAVAAAPVKQTSVEEFCEVSATPEAAKPFALPLLDGPAMARGNGWTWVNIWATWCEPCVEEMPMLVQWQARLAKAGADVTLQFLSVDAKAEDVTRWRGSHPTAPPSMRLGDISQLGAWLTSVGLDASAVIPVHLFIDPEQRVRCVRMGSVSEPEFAAVEKVLKGG